MERTSNYRVPASGPAQEAAKSGGRPGKYRRLNDDERQRAVRACDSCRKVKEKCEGGIPCKRCLHLRRQCHLSEPPSRGNTVNAEDKLVEPSSAFMRDLLERCKHLETIISHHSPDQDLSLPGLRRTVGSLKAEVSHGQHTSRASSENSDEGELPIEDEVCTIDPVDENVAHYSGEYSYWNFSMRLKQHVKELEMDGEAQTAHETDRVPDYWRVEKLQSDPSIVADVAPNLPPRPIAEFLVNVFFTHACDSYYYVERRWLEQKMDFAYQDRGALKANDAAALAIMLTVFAVGSQYAPLESSVIDRSRDGPPGRDEQKIGAKFYRQAVRLLPEIIHLGSLESVQACLLLALYALPIDASGLSYIYLNLALKLGIQNGMHRKPSSKSFSPLTIELRNRIWWSSYCLEKKIVVFHGRPLSVNPADIDCDMPTHVKTLEAANQPTRITYFCVSIRLIQFLEDFVDQFKLIRIDEKQQTSRIVSRLVVIKDNLLKWWQSLVDGNKLHAESDHAAAFRSSMHVQLEYCLVRMFIGRPFLLSRRTPPTDTSSPSGLGSDAGGGSTPTSRGDSTTRKTTNALLLVQECIQAAKEAISICQAIRNSPAGLSHASYIEYSSCRASLLVLIAYSIHFRSDESHDILSMGLNIIRELAATGESARSEVMLIESFERALKRLTDFTKVNHQDSIPETEQNKMDYESFRKWGSAWHMGQPPREEPVTSFPGAPTVQTPRTQYSGTTEFVPRRPEDMAWLPVGTAMDNSGIAIPHDPTGFAMFGFGDMNAHPGGHYQPERQLLEQFINGSDYDMSVGMHIMGSQHVPHQGHPRR